MEMGARQLSCPAIRAIYRVWLWRGACEDGGGISLGRVYNGTTARQQATDSPIPILNARVSRCVLQYAKRKDVAGVNPCRVIKLQAVRLRYWVSQAKETEALGSRSFWPYRVCSKMKTIPGYSSSLFLYLMLKGYRHPLMY